MTKTIYGVYENSDLTEGRGIMLLKALFENEDDAWEFAETKCSGVMGHVPPGGFRAHYTKHGYSDVHVKPHELYLKDAPEPIEIVEHVEHEHHHFKTIRVER